MVELKEKNNWSIVFWINVRWELNERTTAWISIQRMFRINENGYDWEPNVFEISIHNMFRINHNIIYKIHP